MALTEMVIMPGEDYQAICDSVRAKTGGTELLKSGEVAPAIDGIKISAGIDTSDGTAEENDIAQGKIAYVNGERIEGNIPVDSYIDVNAQIWWDQRNNRLNLYSLPDERIIIGSSYRYEEGDDVYYYNDYADLYCPGEVLGDATVEDVRQGVTFTSQNGLKLTGKYVASNTPGGSVSSDSPYSAVVTFQWSPTTNTAINSTPKLTHSLGVIPDGYYIVCENFGDDWETSADPLIACIGIDQLVNDGYYRTFGYARSDDSAYSLGGYTYSKSDVLTSSQITVRSSESRAYFKAGKTYKVIIYKW